VSYNYRNINLIEEEQQALSAIWKQCCSADVNTTTRAIVNEGDGRFPKTLNPTWLPRFERLLWRLLVL
jgi:hypothetical protein